MLDPHQFPAQSQYTPIQWIFGVLPEHGLCAQTYCQSRWGCHPSKWYCDIIMSAKMFIHKSLKSCRCIGNPSGITNHWKIHIGFWMCFPFVSAATWTSGTHVRVDLGVTHAIMVASRRSEMSGSFFWNPIESSKINAKLYFMDEEKLEPPWDEYEGQMNLVAKVNHQWTYAEP